MVALAWIMDSDYIEEEGFHVVVKSFVIKKELGEDAELLTVEFGHLAVHFEDRDGVTAVDFIPRGIVALALGLLGDIRMIRQFIR